VVANGSTTEVREADKRERWQRGGRVRHTPECRTLSTSPPPPSPLSQADRARAAALLAALDANRPLPWGGARAVLAGSGGVALDSPRSASATTDPAPQPSPSAAAAAFAARMARLPPDAQQAQYEAMVASVTGRAEAEAGALPGLGGGGAGVGGSGPSPSSYRAAAVLGLHLAIALGTGFACGHALGGRVLKGGGSKDSRPGALAGGLAGLALALVAEVGLLLARAANSGGGGGGGGGGGRRRPAWVPPTPEQLAGEAAVAAAVVAGAGRARTEGGEAVEDEAAEVEVKKER